MFVYKTRGRGRTIFYYYLPMTRSGCKSRPITTLLRLRNCKRVGDSKTICKRLEVISFSMCGGKTQSARSSTGRCRTLKKNRENYFCRIGHGFGCDGKCIFSGVTITQDFSCHGHLDKNNMKKSVIGLVKLNRPEDFKYPDHDPAEAVAQYHCLFNQVLKNKNPRPGLTIDNNPLAEGIGLHLKSGSLLIGNKFHKKMNHNYFWSETF